MTKNINILRLEHDNSLLAQVLLGDKKIRAARLICEEQNMISLELDDRSDKNDGDKLRIRLDFNSLESVLIVKDWLNDIADQFEKLRLKNSI